MNAPAPSAGPRQVPGWVTRINEAIERVYLLLRIGVVWLLLSLLGLVVAGVGPASCAAADVLLAFRRHEKLRVLPMMWEGFRRDLVRANLRMIPLLVVQTGAAAMLWIAGNQVIDAPVMTAVLGALAAVSGGWATISLAAIAVAPRVRRQDPFVTWRLAILLPGALPLRGIGLLLGLLVWTVVCSLVWPLAVLFGAAVAIDLAVGLLSTRIAMLLEDIAKRSAAPA